METGLALPERPGQAGQSVDGRLVAPALAAWAGAAVGVRWTVPAVVLAAAAGVLAAVPVLLVARARWSPGRRASGWDDDDGRPFGAALLAGTVVFLAAGVLAGALATWPGDHGPLAALVRTQATGTISAVLTDDPRMAAGEAVAGRRGGPLFVAPARLESVTAGGVTVRARAPVVLLGRGTVWQGLLPSQRLVVTGRLSAPVGDPTIAAVVLASAAPSTHGSPNAMQRTAGHLRAGLREAASGLPQPRRGLLPALVVGDVSQLDEDLRADFRRAAMTHLTAVSGGNVAIITAAAVLVAAWARRGRRTRAAVGAAALLAFVVLARPSPSVLRAGAMGLVGLAAVTAGRGRAVLPALAASVLVLVLARPTLAVSVGFALSVQATAGMIILAPGWQVALARRLPDRAAEVLAVAAAAQFSCTPLIAWMGGGVSPIAVPANILAAPAVPVATVLGVLALACAAVSMPLAQALAQVAGVPCWWLVTVAHRCAALPVATLGWPGGATGASGALVAVVVGVALARRRWGRRVVAAALVGLLLARCAVVDRVARWPPPDWRLVACDVGQGDALVLRTGPAAGLLVDAGPDPALLTRCLRDLGVRQLSAIMLSHLHADHVDGLPGVLGRLPVGEVLVGPLLEPVGQWRKVQRWAGGARVPVRPLTAGATGRSGELCWTVLGPRTVLHGTDSDPNNDSLLVSAQAGLVRVLLTGDIEAVAQQRLTGPAGVRGALRADVLKVPHHGSANQDPRFLAATGARYALVSAGADNDYGHPALATLRVLAQAGITVARTDRDGAIAVAAPAAPCQPPGVRDDGRGPSPGGAPVTMVRQRAGEGS